MKKLITVLLALLLVMALCVPAFASEGPTESSEPTETPEPTTYTITMSSTTGHTYAAYQVFAGDLYDHILSNIVWGSGVDGDALLAALQADATYGADFADCETAADVADVLDELADDSDAIKAIAKIIAANKTTASGTGTTQITDLPAGYYLIVDETAAASMPAGDSYSNFILKVVDDVTVEAKDGTVTSQKKVKDNNDTAGSVTDWQDSADYDIGDEVPFQLTAALPANYDTYTAYELTFHDVQSAGLTFNPASVKVYVDGVEITTGFEVVTTDLTDDCTFEIVFANLKDIAAVDNNSVITVEYTSTLNENAVTGTAGNPNQSWVSYSNNPNDTTTGTTPTDKVVVFTYKLIINKVDENNDALVGASFALYKKIAPAEAGAEPTWELIGEITGTNLSTFEWTGLDDGDYKLVETVTPGGYNTVDDIEFTITAEHDAEGADPQLTSLTGSGTGITLTPDLSEGSLTGSIMNQSGATLPSTGGIGTTIFYIIGGVLVAGVVIFLVARKRSEV